MIWLKFMCFKNTKIHLSWQVKIVVNFHKTNLQGIKMPWLIIICVETEDKHSLKILVTVGSVVSWHGTLTTFDFKANQQKDNDQYDLQRQETWGPLTSFWPNKQRQIRFAKWSEIPSQVYLLYKNSTIPKQEFLSPGAKSANTTRFLQLDPPQYA